MEKIEVDKKILNNVINHFEFYIDKTIKEVLNDDEDDPQYSAVTVNNFIKWFINIKQSLGEDLNYQDVEGYFLNSNWWTKKEYNLFEKKRKKESEYYHGEQY